MLSDLVAGRGYVMVYTLRSACPFATPITLTDGTEGLARVWGNWFETARALSESGLRESNRASFLRAVIAQVESDDSSRNAVRCAALR